MFNKASLIKLTFFIICVLIISFFVLISEKLKFFDLIKQPVKYNNDVKRFFTQSANQALKEQKKSTTQSKLTNVPLDRLLNLPIKFKFLIKPKTSCDENKKLIIFVNTKIDHFAAREEIRTTWGSLQKSLNYQLIFLIGLQERKNSSVEKFLNEEHKLNDDLVRGNFIDTYRNLTYKHIMGFKYILHNCAKVNFIMKADDDAFVNIFEIIDLLNLELNNSHLKRTFKNGDKSELDFLTNREFKNDFKGQSNDKLNSLNGLNHNNYYKDHYNSDKNYAEIKLLNIVQNELDDKSNELIYRNQKKTFYNCKKLVEDLTKKDLKFIACSLFPNGTKTKRTGKWALTYEEYNLGYFPPYCSGIAYFLNINALRLIYSHVHQMKKILFIDDLFLTGIVIQQIRKEKTGYLNYLNFDSPKDYSNTKENDYLSIKYPFNSGDYRNQKDEMILTKLDSKSDFKLDSKNVGKEADFQILDWSFFYNYRWSEFIKALAQKDNGFNSVFFINDLDKMPNRNELVKIAWKKIKNYYLIP